MSPHYLITQNVLGTALLQRNGDLIALCLKAIWEEWPENDETGVLATRANHSMTCFAFLKSLGWTLQVDDSVLTIFTPDKEVWAPKTST